MDPLFIWIETSAFSVFLREAPSLWVFPFILILHTVGLAFFVGANVAWDVRVIGFSPAVPLATLRRYFLVMWLGLWVNAVSGVLLLIAYPTKAMTNPLFYAKLALIAAGIWLALRLRHDAVGAGVLVEGRRGPRIRMLAALSLVCWTAVIFAGRFLAYTCTRLTVDSTC